jgi:thiol:disulfide interchange protein DsbD
MGLLFLALGLSTHATRFLPKSGAWMNRIKIFFGVLLLGASLYYLDILLVSSKVIQGSLITRALSAPQPAKSGFKTDTMNWQPYSDALLHQAAADGKPAIIDFRADWCAACLEMEEKTFTDQGLQLLSGQFVMLRFDATQDSTLLGQLRQKYNIVGLPTVIFVSKSGEWLKELTLTEFEAASPFRDRMTKALR